MKKEKIIGKKYYRIAFHNTSPLSIGSGENVVTDQDILLDGCGRPYIPGTALAGVYRSQLTSAMDEKTLKNYFGGLAVEEAAGLTGKAWRTAVEKGEDKESLFIIYDAVIAPESLSQIRITKRDMVALDEYKTAIDGAKFDFQILEPGVKFITYIEQNLTENCQEDIGGQIARAFQTGELRMGSKTGRGFGAVKADEIHVAEFSFCKKEEDKQNPKKGNHALYDTNRWLDFSMYDAPGNNEQQNGSCWEEIEESDLPEASTPANRLVITLDLKQAGGISIRRYTTDENGADYEQLTITDPTDPEKGEIPVIPGTSWAGAFRAQMRRLNPDLCQEAFFGRVKDSVQHTDTGKENIKNQSKEYYKTHVFFSESRIEDAKPVVYTRNAIDRFTGAAATGALYTEKTWFEGHTTLEIVYDDWDVSDKTDQEKQDQEAFLITLAAAITDLKEGYMAVGGLTAVGRGLFECTKITVQHGSDSDKLEEQNLEIMKQTSGAEDETDPVFQWLVAQFKRGEA